MKNFKKVFFFSFLLMLIPVFANAQRAAKEGRNIEHFRVKKNNPKVANLENENTFNAASDTISAERQKGMRNHNAKRLESNEKMKELLVLDPTSVYEEYPQVVIIEENGDTIINYNLLIPYLILTIQEQEKRIEKLEAKQKK